MRITNEAKEQIMGQKLIENKSLQTLKEMGIVLS